MYAGEEGMSRGIFCGWLWKTGGGIRLITYLTAHFGELGVQSP
jgi:hypothetical protein